MDGKIFVLQENGSLVDMNQEDYNAEAVLQELVEKYPDLLAGDQMNSAEPRRWLLVKREMSVPDAQNGSGRWALDHLFLDQDGIPTLVEVKRSTDTRIRREVVGQMLDYAANGVAYWPVGTLQTSFVATWKEKANQKLADFLMVDENDAADADNVDGPEVEINPAFEAFWQKVSANLQAGTLRLLFVADEIPTELQRIIEFLNEKMDSVEVLGVEIKQFAGQQMKTLVPRVIGKTGKAETRKARANAVNDSPKLDEQTFFQNMQTQQGMAKADVAHALLDWANNRRLSIKWGVGLRTGSFIPMLNHKGKNISLFAVKIYGQLELYFLYLSRRQPFDNIAKREELLAKVNAVLSSNLPADAMDRYPKIDISEFLDAEKLTALLQVMDWVIQELRAS